MGIFSRELSREPIPRRLITMGQHDAAWSGLQGEFQQVFPVGVAAQFKSIDPRLELNLHVGLFKKEGIACVGGQ